MLKLRVIISSVLVLVGIIIFLFLTFPRVKRVRKYNKEVNSPKLFRWNADVMEEYQQEYKQIKLSRNIWACSYLLLVVSLAVGIVGLYVSFNYYDQLIMNISAILLIASCLIGLYTFRSYTQIRVRLYQRILEKTTDEFVEDRLKIVEESEIYYRYQMIALAMIGVAAVISL